jgi:hypothetical protein
VQDFHLTKAQQGFRMVGLLAMSPSAFQGYLALRKFIMLKLYKDFSEAKQEKLLNPQMSDEFETFFYGKYGRRLYTIKVGRKWVYMKSSAHKVRMPLRKFKVHAFLEWRRIARTQASVEAMQETGKYKRKNGWWKAFGFETNPENFEFTTKDLAW